MPKTNPQKAAALDADLVIIDAIFKRIAEHGHRIRSQAIPAETDKSRDKSDKPDNPDESKSVAQPTHPDTKPGRSQNRNGKPKTREKPSA